MLALKPEGPKPQLAKFFQQAAQGYEFLALWYQISASDQAELLQLVNSAYVKTLK